MFKKKLSPSVLNLILLCTFSVSLLLLLISFSINISDEFSGKSIWSTAHLIIEYSYFDIIALLFVGLFIVNIALFVISLIQLLNKKIVYKKFIPIYMYFNIGLLIFYMLVSVLIDLYSFPMWILLFFILLIHIASLIIYILNKEKKDNIFNPEEQRALYLSNAYKIGMLIINTISIVLLLIFMAFPMFTREGVAHTLIGIFDGNYTLDIYIIALMMYVFYIIAVIFYISSISAYIRNKNEFVKRSQLLNVIVTGVIVINFIIATSYVFILRIINIPASTVSYIPLFIMIVIALVFAFFQGHFEMKKTKEKNNKKKKESLRILPLIFVFLFTAITVCSIFLKFINIEFELFGTYIESYNFTGLDLLKDYAKLNNVFQAFASIYALFIFISGCLLFITLFSFLGKSKEYYKFAKASVYTNFILTFLLAVLGIFFIFNQKIMDSYIEIILEYLDASIDFNSLYTSKVNTQIIYASIASFLLLIIMLVTKQLNHSAPKAIESKSEFDNQSPNNYNLQLDNSNSLQNGEKIEEEFDPCPAFSELDENRFNFIKDYKNRQKYLIENPSLPELVRFVVEYARESRLHLFYTYEDMATFIAGIGSSKLSILQGMSGIGKTSLPKIFTEAIIGHCELIEVESSWRDKNELIGYYNEFSKRFTPRKFTQALYRACLNNNIPTFIVLDEMNLSRVEYYFSDFLSLMESEEDKREIKLLNIKIAPQGNPEKTSYLGLRNGHTLKIPSNVWFIGTANQDESTFEISDKVYDRAQTMNFIKRAKKMKIINTEIAPQFWSFEILSNLFTQAKKAMEYDAEKDALIQEVEGLLVSYNISFGNRSLLQIEEFVKIYCACFDNNDIDTQNNIMKNAIDSVLVSKVIRKLTTKQLDNKEKLAKAFDKLNLPKCSAFIRTLEEA